MLRKIIEIDEEKCTGCGLCVTKCAEGALQIINGKARLVKESYCDGLGACLGECPEGALKIVERDVEAFNEEEVHRHLEEMKKMILKDELPCGCPGSSVRNFEPSLSDENIDDEAEVLKSELTHWPVQLTLVPPSAPFLQNREVLLAADCVPFAYPNFHKDFLKGRAVLVACPKLDNFNAHVEKLAMIFKFSNITKIIIAHMEVPCCFGLTHMVSKAMEIAGKKIEVEDVTVGVKGDIL